MSFVGGLTTRMDKDGSWIFAFISVGDCKAYLRGKHSQQVVDLTPLQGNTRLVGTPDTQARLYLIRCEQGDIIFLCSSGLHSQFEGQHTPDPSVSVQVLQFLC